MSGKKVHQEKQREASSNEQQTAQESPASSETLEELAQQFNRTEGKVEDVVAQEPAGAKSAQAQEKIATLEQEVKALSERILRLNAEMENLRRRHQKERSEAQSSGIKNFAVDMSNVLDNLYRALENIDEEQLAENEMLKNIHTGVEMTRKSMEAAFERYKIKRLDPLGERFDHDLHQAVSQVEDEEKETGTVVQVIQPGYVIEEKLLRPALVVVSK